MGITISYRGSLADLGRIEDFEDRLLDLALDVGGLAQIWRSHADDDPKRMVRGVILDLAPGLESTSLLISPEGWLVGLTDIQDAECGLLTEPPWCFTKTQFGSVEGHVALIEMLRALKAEFLPNLEVIDEGGYWEARDLAELTRRRALVQAAIEGLAEGLQRHGLSPEAAEDPNILLTRIERIAAQVHQILQKPPEHPPVHFPEDEGVGKPDPETTEALWDEMFKHNRRQQEGMQRAIEERRSRGEDVDQAFENALSDLGLETPDETEAETEEWSEDAEDPFAGAIEEEDELTEATGSREADERHPLLERAMDLLHYLHKLFGNVESRFESSLRTLLQGAGDAMGGLAQGLSRRRDDDDLDDFGLRITQLKRALRGAAFARGALFPLRDAVKAETFGELFHTLGQLEKGIFHEIGQLRSQYGAGES
jgi:hypothetical protein